MHIRLIISYLVLCLLCQLGLGLGCGKMPARAPLNVPMHDEWLIKGRLSNSSFHKGEVVALGMNGTRYRTRIKENSTFGLSLPGSAVYALYFILPYENSKNENSSNAPAYAVLTYENGVLGESETIRLPETNLFPMLDLGIVDIKGHHAYPAHNPSNMLDFDHDGIFDILDLDDQNDGIDDKKQRENWERVTICYYGFSQAGQEKIVHLSELLPYLDQGAIIGSCRKR